MKNEILELLAELENWHHIGCQYPKDDYGECDCSKKRFKLIREFFKEKNEQ